MIYDIFTGILSACFIILSLLYPLRRKFKNRCKWNKRKFHCSSGYLVLVITLLHINLKLENPYLSAGFLSFVALLLVALTGFLKWRFGKNRFFYAIHVSSAVVFVIVLFLHAIQQGMNLLFM